MPTSKTSEASARRASAGGWALFIARWLGRTIVMVIHRHWPQAARLRSSASDFRSTAIPKPSRFLRESPEKQSPDVRYQGSSRTLRVLPRPGYLKSSICFVCKLKAGEIQGSLRTAVNSFRSGVPSDAGEPSGTLPTTSSSNPSRAVTLGG